MLNQTNALKDAEGRFMPSGENNNILNDMVCPCCGFDERFEMDATCTVTCYDDDYEYEDMGWDNDSKCWCPNCGYGGILAEFQYKGDETYPVSDHAYIERIQKILELPVNSEWLAPDGRVFKLVSKNYHMCRIEYLFSTEGESKQDWIKNDILFECTRVED